MSFWDDLASWVGGGSGGSTVTVTNTPSNDVEVNPEITNINVIDMEPLEGLLAEIADQTVALEDAQAEAQAARDKLFSDIKLWLAVGAFGLAFYRMRKT